MFDGKEHNLKNNAILTEHGLVRCLHRPAPGQGECGAVVWIYRQPNGWKYVAVVDPKEILFMEHRHMSAEEALAYLGTEVPRQAR